MFIAATAITVVVVVVAVLPRGVCYCITSPRNTCRITIIIIIIIIVVVIIAIIAMTGRWHDFYLVLCS